MVCAECGLTVESPYYFRTPELCRKCFAQLPVDVQHRIITEYPKAPWELRPTTHSLLKGVGRYLSGLKGASLVIGWVSWVTAALAWCAYLAVVDSNQGRFSEWKTQESAIAITWCIIPVALGVAGVATIVSVLAKPRSLRGLVGPVCLAIAIGFALLWLWGFVSALAIQ